MRQVEPGTVSLPAEVCPQVMPAGSRRSTLLGQRSRYRYSSTDPLFHPGLSRVRKSRITGKKCSLCVHLAAAHLVSVFHSLRTGKASLTNAPEENGVLVLVPESGATAKPMSKKSSAVEEQK